MGISNAGTVSTLRGTVERLFKQSEGFSAGKMKTTDGSIVSFAIRDYIPVGEAVAIEGEWTVHEKFGRQFKGASWRSDKSAMTTEGLATYLAARPEFKEIGKSRARKIADMYGSEFESVLCDQNDRFIKETKIPADVARALRDAWLDDRETNAAAAELASFGVSPAKARKIVQVHGASAVAMTKDNPWWLLRRVSGIGFKGVDAIARKLGTAKDHPDRITAGIEYACEDSERGEGHTWISFEDLVGAAKKLLDLDALDADAVIESAIEKCSELIESPTDPKATTSTLSRFRTRDGAIAVAHTETLRAEAFALRWFSSAAAEKGLRPNLTAEDARMANSGLNEDQAEAVARAFQTRVSVLTGGAGVGKTYTIGSILDVCDHYGFKTLLCAPTGKAARRMEESVQRSASTIHRMLQPVPASEYQSELAEMSDEEKAKLRSDLIDAGYIDTDDDLDEGESEVRFVFRVPTLSQLTADLIIVDESSMMDAKIWSSLLRAIPPKASLLIVGDANQLPPVGAGSTLRDLVAGRFGGVPVTKLTKVVRQAGSLKECVSAVLEGRISKTTPAKREGNEIWPWAVVSTLPSAVEVGNYVEKLWRDLLPGLMFTPPNSDEKRNIMPEIDVQILSPTRKGPAGTVSINRTIQRLEQAKRGFDVDPPKFPDQQPEPMIGDRVIWTKNDYELNVMNGTMGYVQFINPDKSLEVQFEGVVDEEGNPEPTTVPANKRDRIQLAWAITIHKSQGAEFPIVVNVVSKSHSFQLHRGLVYTSVSRARRSAILIGDSYGMTVSTQERSDSRRTLAIAV